MEINERNLWREIEFVIADQALRRRLVPEVQDFESEISACSPVGEILLGAGVGDELIVDVPGGRSIVKVLSVN